MEMPNTNQLPVFVYGLKGIRDLFGVSTSTAQEYKNTWLAPAVQQRGKKIIVNVSQALKLFNGEKTPQETD